MLFNKRKLKKQHPRNDSPTQRHFRALIWKIWALVFLGTEIMFRLHNILLMISWSRDENVESDEINMNYALIRIQEFAP